MLQSRLPLSHLPHKHILNPALKGTESVAQAAATVSKIIYLIFDSISLLNPLLGEFVL